MVAYVNGSWNKSNLPTNQRRTDNNPFLADEFIDQFPELTADAEQFQQMYPTVGGGQAFITNDPGYANIPNAQQWTLKTDPNEWANEFPDNRPTTQKYYVAYNNSEDRWTGGVGLTKEEAKAGGDGTGNKVAEITVDVVNGTYTAKDGTVYTGFTSFLQGETDPSGNNLSGGGQSGAKDALKGFRDQLEENKKQNDAAPGQREQAMKDWNTTNVWIPVTQYATDWNNTAAENRQTAANEYNSNIQTLRQETADAYNQSGDFMYNKNTSINRVEDLNIDWATNTRSGQYTSNRDQIFNGVPASHVQNLLDSGFINQSEANDMLNTLKNSYGSYYVDKKIGGMWDGNKDGGQFDLVGGFDAGYYLTEYGSSTGITAAWENAIRYGDASNPYDPNNDLDVTARYGTLANLAWHNYSTTGKTAGLRGQEEQDTDQANAYKNTLTEAELQIIRDQALGLTGINESGRESIDWGENILDSNTDATPSLLEGRLAGIFSDADLEQQDKFAALAQDVLKTSVDELKKQQAKERELDVFRNLPGFNEVYGAGSSLADSLLGDSGIGGYLGMIGMDANKVGSDLEDQLQNLTGIPNTNNAEYNWTKWMEENLIERLENMESIEGERVDEDGNVISYDLTTEEGKAFMDKFLKDYVRPRFNMSKSMSEFVSYLDTIDEDSQNVFQTQTAMNALKSTAEVRARAYFTELQQNTPAAEFNADFYFDPTQRYADLTEEELQNELMAPAETLARYQEQKEVVNRDWAQAKTDPSQKIPGGQYTWEQAAYLYGADLNDKDQFARLHYEVAGIGSDGLKFEAAADLVDAATVSTWINDTLLPLVAEEKLDLNDAAFLQFITPDEFADSILKGIDPTENKEEWKQVLEQFGIEDLDASLEEVKEYIAEAFETGEAQAIREGIKYLNEKKEEVSQETLGVDYIDRDPLEILGEPGSIEVGSDAWKELMRSYDLDENLTYQQATDALDDKKDYDVESRNPMYEIFKSNGYAGSEQDFMNEFFPDATEQDLADLDFVGRAMSGDLKLDEISSDPFVAMSQFESFLGGTDQDLYGVEDDDDDDDDSSNFFDLFPDEDYASDTGRGIIDSWTGNLFR